MRSGGLQNPLAGFWFGRFAVLPLRSFAPRASPVWVEALEWATPSHVIIDLELLAHPQSRIVSLQMGGADGWLGLEIAWPPQGCVPPGART